MSEIPVSLDLQGGGPTVYQGQQFDPKLLRIVFGEGTQPVNDPDVALSVKIAKARAARLDRQREIDRATMPYVQSEIVQSQTRETEIMAKIDEAMNVLKSPPPTAQTGLNEGETIATAISGILAPQNLPRMLTAIAQVSGARTDQELDEKLRAHGLTRETTMLALRHLYEQAGRESSLQTGLEAEKRELQLSSLRTQSEIESWYDNALIEAAELERKLGVDMEKFRLELAEKKAEREVQAAKEQKQYFESQFDNIRQEIGNLSQYADPSQQLRALAERIRRLVQQGADPNSAPTVPTGKTRAQVEADENQAYRKQQDAAQAERQRKDDEYRQQRDRKADEKWFAEKSAQGIITGTVDNWQINPNFKDKKARGAEITKLDKEIKDARAKVDTLLNVPFIASPDEEKAAEEQRKRENELYETLRAEYRAAMAKRQLVGGSKVTALEYLRERYPQFKSIIDMFFGRNEEPVRRDAPVPKGGKSEISKVKLPAGWGGG